MLIELNGPGMDLSKLNEEAQSWEAELQLEQEENTRSTILPCQKAEGGTEDKEREVTNSTLNSNCGNNITG